MNPTHKSDNSGLRELVKELIDILNLSSKHHRKLVELLREKKRAIVELKHEEVERILDLEREVIGSIATADEERVRLTGEVAISLGKPGGTLMRLSEIILAVDEDLRDDLFEVRDELRDTAEELERLNRLNRTLIVESVDHVNLFVAMLAGKDPEAKTDTNGGSESDEGMPALVINKRV